jgi:DNA-binding NarL/FixJ family response regulator
MSIFTSPSMRTEGVAGSQHRGRILVVDDQPAVRAGVSRLIATALSNRVEVRAAATIAEALVLVAGFLPHVVVLDIDLEGDDGLRLIPQLSASIRVLILSCHGDPTTRARADSLGVTGFIEKHEPAARLIAQLHVALPWMGEGEQAPMSPGAGSREVPGETSGPFSPRMPQSSS